MPVYSATALVTALYQGDSKTVINAEQLTNGQSSICVAFGPSADSTGMISFSVEFQFASSPSTPSLGVQTADTDTDASFVGIGFGGASPGVITTVNAGFAARVELLTASNFARVLVTNNGGVNLTARIVRH